ncbi:MAG: hypothetical protein M5U34_29595 [Chloroflexi bacterium]|nr:hypothetical protein [Chloroflexota bacterium]
MRQVEQAQRDAQNKLAQAEGQLGQLQERLKEQASPAPTQNDETVQLEKRRQQLTAVLQSAQSKSEALRQKRDEAATPTPGAGARPQNGAPPPQRRAKNAQQATPRAGA